MYPGITVPDIKPVPETTNALVFTFTSVVGSNWTFNMPINLCNRWGYTTPVGGIVTVRYNASTGEYTYTVSPSLEAR